MALRPSREKWFSKCFSKAVTGSSHKVPIFGVYNVFGSCRILITFFAVRLNTHLPHDDVEDLSHYCLCFSILSAQVKSQRCPGMALVHCRWFVTYLREQTSRPWLHLNVGGGVCFLSFSCCHGYSRVCVPSHALSKQSHSHLYPICHPFSLSDTYCDKMLCIVDWWNVVWRSEESVEAMWLCEWPYCLDWCWLKPLVDSFTTNWIGVESHQSIPGERTAERPPLQHQRLQNNPAVEECQINVLFWIFSFFINIFL